MNSLEQKINVRQLFMLICSSCFALFVPLGIVVAFMVLLGVAPVNFNGETTYGIGGFFIALILYTLILPIGAILLISMILLPGLWLYKIFHHLISSYRKREVSAP